MDNNIKRIDEFLCIARELLDSNLFDLVPWGPTTDFGYGREGYVWEFGYNVDDIEFYIKLKIEERMGRQCLICLSFHVAEYPLHFPYGGVEKC